jgi:hypothetical protein
MREKSTQKNHSDLRSPELKVGAGFFLLPEQKHPVKFAAVVSIQCCVKME